MFTREFQWRPFLHGVWGTQPLREYCARRSLPCPATGLGPPSPADELAGWALYRSLAPRLQAAIEADARRVNELASPEANALLAAAAAGALPPPDVPAGEAFSLWYFLNRPALFAEAFRRHRTTMSGTWRVGRTAPGIRPGDLEACAAALAATLPGTYADRATDARAVVEAYPTPDGCVFEAHVSERVRRIATFPRTGGPLVADLRPATPVVFAYEAATGVVRVYSRLRARSRAHALLELFGRVALGCPVQPVSCVYDLDRLKQPRQLPPDAPDMESVRVRSLSLAYPSHQTRRRLTLETAAGDDPQAIFELLRDHVAHPLLEQMTVTHAELLICLRAAGDRRCVTVRLWPDGSSLGPDGIGARLHACLTRWGLAHA